MHLTTVAKNDKKMYSICLKYLLKNILKLCLCKYLIIIGNNNNPTASVLPAYISQIIFTENSLIFFYFSHIFLFLYVFESILNPITSIFIYFNREQGIADCIT